MYTFDSRVRYSETDPDSILKIESLIDYLQDCSTFQSEDGKVGIQYMKEHHVAWIVNYWQIDINRLPVLGEHIRIGTSPYELKGFIGLRNFMIESLDHKGERLVNTNSVWSLFDLEKGMPVRVLPEMSEVYELQPRFDMEYTPRKIAVPDHGGVEHRAFEVAETMLDSNRHVNNAQYVRLAMSTIPEEMQIKRLRVEYRKQAMLGDRIHPVSYEDGQVVVSLNADDGNPYAVISAES